MQLMNEYQKPEATGGTAHRIRPLPLSGAPGCRKVDRGAILQKQPIASPIEPHRGMVCEDEKNVCPPLFHLSLGNPRCRYAWFVPTYISNLRGEVDGSQDRRERTRFPALLEMILRGAST